MILIQFISTLIEDFAMSQFLLSYFHIQSQLKLFFLTFVSIIETYVFNYIIVNNDLLIFCLALTYFIFLFIETKKISFLTIAIPILIICIVVFSNCVALILTPIIHNIDTSEISLHSESLITSMFISRTILIILFCTFQKFIKKEKDKIDIKDWWLFILFMLVIFVMLISIVEAIIYDEFRRQLIFNLLIELTVITIICFILYYNIKRQNEIDLKVKEELVKKEYQTKMYSMMDHLFDKITVDKHMMMYTLMKIEMLLKVKNYEEAHDFASKELNKMLNYKYLSSTGNILFDYEMSELVNYLREKNINVKTVFALEKENKILSNQIIIQFIVENIKKIIKSDPSTKKLEIFFSEANNKVVFKLMIVHGNELDLSIIENLKKQSFIKRVHHKEEKLYTELNFLISL